MNCTTSRIGMLAAVLAALGITGIGSQSRAQETEETYCGDVDVLVEEAFFVACDTVNSSESQSVINQSLSSQRATCRQSVNRVLSCQNSVLNGLAKAAKAECANLPTEAQRDDCEQDVRQQLHFDRNYQAERIAARDACDAVIADAAEGGCPVCPNGIVELREECDDGNFSNLDRCTTACIRHPYCNDGIVDPGEQCDEDELDEAKDILADPDHDPDMDGCDRQCVRTSNCGNGVREPGEECDDGNANNLDQCTTQCVRRDGRGDPL